MFKAAISTLFIFSTICAFAQSFAPNSGAGDGFVGRFLANYIITFYNTGSNNFPSDEATSVLQTRDGYMWFGSYSGLIRYDGRRFTVWDAVSQGGFRSSNIRALYESGGTLWIGTNDRGLVRHRNGVFTTYDKTMGTPSNMIRGITGTTDGRIFCGTPDGLFYIDTHGNIRTINLDTSIHPFIISVASDTQNNIYMVFNTGEFFVYTQDGKTIQFPFSSQLRRVTYVSGHRIVGGTRDGDVIITQFDGENFSNTVIKQTPNRNISAIYEDSRGFIWIASETGIGLLDTNLNYHHIGNPTGAGFFTGIWEDYQNGFWITAYRGGVVKFTLSAFTSFNALHNIETGTANAIVKDRGKIYIGTNNGLFILDENGNPAFTHFSERIGSRTRVRSVFRDSSGNIWVCTFSNLGVIRFNPETGEYRYWNQDDGLISDRTRCITELPNGIIVVGTAAGVSFIRGDSIITANEAFDTDALITLPDITILSLEYANNTLFIGTDGSGIYAVNRNGTTRYREADGLTGGVVLRITANPQTNGIWVSASNGLSYIGENGIVRVIEKVPPLTFLDIMRYRDDLILMTSSRIIRTNANALLDPSLPFEYIGAGRATGLTSSINANAWNLITEDGYLYICCDNGIFIFNFENRLSPVIPFAGITRITVDGREYTDFSGTITLPRDAYRLTFELSFLSFGVSDNAVMYYILEGQDNTKQLLPKTGSLEVSYTNLRGGNYSFRVWTQDSAGNIGNLIEVNLIKESRLFERPVVWVITAVFAMLLIVLLIFVIDRHRSRIHYAKHREYRTIIFQALTALVNSIDAKDSYTSGHSMRVAAYSAEIARRMGMNKDFIENLYYIGLLHDVGKIGISNDIINKPGSLSKEEFEIMKQHVVIGQDILKDITTINNLAAGAAEHHERWDGSGYNTGINGKNISLEGRIIAIADAYDAMSTNRSYRNGLPKEAILKEISGCKGYHFDPEITKLVIDMIEHDYFSVIDINKIIDISGGKTQ